VTDLLLKVEGAGNDFLLGVGEWAGRLADDEALVVRLCRRRLGLGADGTLAVFPRGDNAVRVVYRNADGSRAAFCANGTRCAARAGAELLGLGPELDVITDWATLPAVVEGDRVTLELPPPPASSQELNLEASGRTWRCWLLEVGVPHLVVQVEAGLGDLDLERLAPPLRAHPQLGPGGANVNFVTDCGADQIAVRTWERGVEGETLSCGSGVVAAGLVWMARRRAPRLTAATRSGEDLVVEAVGEPPECASRLKGRARFLARLELRDEFLAST
jgi:diaminopimelate epimerase